MTAEAYGLAGARIDRIAETATANKRSIYMHFGTKEELFDKVVADSMIKLAESASFEAGDLPAYAGELFDRLEQWPHIRRLYLWAGLERDQPVDTEVEQYRKRVAALEAAQEAGRIRADIPSAELMAMVIALVISWDTAAWSLKALQPENRRETSTDHRHNVTAAVAALARPATGFGEGADRGAQPSRSRR
ncbi:TetR family transcriptional regulator [Streptomyces endocoffeicus]|uniref:TetR family transcriptional regulator n=1 Tax=Streptomyces endocoffeicus TaxID=2898945 RepID=UPI0027DBD66D|nr:TetR family transcriptional regulator [Streptomyces endocoffeicus]